MFFATTALVLSLTLLVDIKVGHCLFAPCVSIVVCALPRMDILTGIRMDILRAYLPFGLLTVIKSKECIISGLNICITRLKFYSFCQLKVSPPLQTRSRLSLGVFLGLSP